MDGFRECPACAEDVGVNDAHCKYCGQDLSASRVHTDPGASEAKSENPDPSPNKSPWHAGTLPRVGLAGLVVALAVAGFFLKQRADENAAARAVADERRQELLEAAAADEEREREEREEERLERLALDACVSTLANIVDRMAAGDSSVFYEYGAQSWEVTTAQGYVSEWISGAFQYGAGTAALEVELALRDECEAEGY